MILHSLKLCNFRQFKGEQQLAFADDDRKVGGGGNVTVIFGENGRGKTGIFRAVVFCLFGERRLSQDGDVPDAELQLVNTSALDENTGRPVKDYVELEFSHKEKHYILRRTL